MPKPRKAHPTFEAPHGYHRPNHNWKQMLMPVARSDRANEWHLVPIDFPSAGAANNAALRIRKREVELPPGIWAAKGFQGKLYVKYLGRS